MTTMLKKRWPFGPVLSEHQQLRYRCSLGPFLIAHQQGWEYPHFASLDGFSAGFRYEAAGTPLGW